MVAVKEASDVIVVFTMEKLLNIYFEKEPQMLRNKKEKLCSGMDWKHRPAQSRGKSPLSGVCGEEITHSRISGVLRGVRVVKSLESCRESTTVVIPIDIQNVCNEIQTLLLVKTHVLS